MFPELEFRRFNLDRSETYSSNPLPPRLQVIKNLSTTIYGLAVKKLLYKPENKPRFASFCPEKLARYIEIE